jgi:hypothetical protein
LRLSLRSSQFRIPFLAGPVRRDPLIVGSPAHKELFCRSFIETHRKFEPTEIRWPDLEWEDIQRLKALPVWNEATRTEAETAVKVQTLGERETDPVLSEAIALQGYEEGRHAAIIRLLTERYGIPVDPFPQPRPPRDATWAFLKTGYGECIDSFFAFGLFEMGRRSEYFPPALTDIFEQIVQEEARHILFLVNWAAYRRGRFALPLRPLYDAWRAWAVGTELVGHVFHALTFGKGSSQEGFEMGTHKDFGEISPRAFLELCLSENERRLSIYDPRLPRPRLIPSLVRMALRLMPRAAAGGSGAHPGADLAKGGR